MSLTIEKGSPLAVAVVNLPLHADIIDDLRLALEIPHEERNSIESGVAILTAALDHGLISARAAAKHVNLTLDDLADLCVAYGHPKPFDI